MGIRRGSSMKAKSVKTASNVTLASSLSLALLLGCAAQQSPPVSIQDSDESQKELATEVQNETEEQIIINEPYGR